jgi:hypothetical protein
VAYRADEIDAVGVGADVAPAHVDFAPIQLVAAGDEQGAAR